MFRELMSYCRPRWISDYVWSKFEERVRIVTGFENAPGAMVQMMSTRSLQGFAGPGETADWGIVAGQLVDATAATITPTQSRASAADGRQVMVPVAISVLTDDETLEFAVNLTAPTTPTATSSKPRWSSTASARWSRSAACTAAEPVPFPGISCTLARSAGGAGRRVISRQFSVVRITKHLLKTVD